jgi:hypothetical protein
VYLTTFFHLEFAFVTHNHLSSSHHFKLKPKTHQNPSLPPGALSINRTTIIHSNKRRANFLPRQVRLQNTQDIICRRSDPTDLIYI